MLYKLTSMLMLVGAMAHYADPNTSPGCASDEQKIQIQGIQKDVVNFILNDF